MADIWHHYVAGLDLGAILALAFGLGLLHGITPDEHTWPITFSYAVGSYSARGGARAGLMFSLSFTAQRALAAELAYYALLPVRRLAGAEFYVYVVVGTVMLASGLYVLGYGRTPHLFTSHRPVAPGPRAVPGCMPLIHGFIAGWGTGAYALVIYTVLAPATGSARFAFLPGLAFGLGTLCMQVLLGSMVGAWMARRCLSERARVFVARSVAGFTLTWGGVAFVLIGLLGIAYPEIDRWRMDASLPLHNLVHLDVGFFLAVVVLFSVAGIAFVRSLREAGRRFGRAGLEPALWNEESGR